MICILLYPSHMSYFEKRTLFPSPSIASCMLGSGMTSFSMYLLTGLKSWTILNVPFFCGSENSLVLIVSGASFFKGIQWSHSLLGGNRLASFSEKTLACLWYSGGIIVVLTVSEFSRCFSAICCTIVTLPISLVSISRTWVFSCSFAI